LHWGFWVLGNCPVLEKYACGGWPGQPGHGRGVPGARREGKGAPLILKSKAEKLFG